MEFLIIKFIDDRFGDYKTCEQNGHFIIYNGNMYVVGAFIYNHKQFNYMQHIQVAIMDMFSLTIEEVDWYMKKWVAKKFNFEVFGTDGVYGH